MVPRPLGTRRVPPLTSRGSSWLRREPHIHTPGTLLEDRFGGDWDGYLERLRTADPPLAAVGITDYASLDNYERAVAARDAGTLPPDLFLFPNVELRLGYRVGRGSRLNIHLLVSPEDDAHVLEMRNALGRLTAPTNDGADVFCTPRGLCTLGGSPVETRAALALGFQRFGPSFETFRDWWQKNEWLRSNTLVAVSASSSDGVGGLPRDDELFQNLGEALSTFSHLFFSAHPNTRRYWLGELTKIPPAIKPCIHGSDAHELDRVARPDDDRFCWIKAEPTFEGLRQLIYEPHSRVSIGDAAPERPMGPETIASLSIEDPSGCLPSTTISINPGLVAIVGHRGSGKTALLDCIAYAASAPLGDGSFLGRAHDRLTGLSVTITWADGETTERRIDGQGGLGDLTPHGDSPPAVRYLSQKFVEHLCVDDAHGDDLRAEIESVVFSRIPDERRFGAGSFADLREYLTEPIRAERERHRQRAVRLSGEIAAAAVRLQTRQRLEDSRKSTAARRDAAQGQLQPLLAQLGQQAPEVRQTLSSLAKIQERIAALSTEAATLEEKKHSIRSAYRELAAEAESFVRAIADAHPELASEKLNAADLLEATRGHVARGIDALSRRVDHVIGELDVQTNAIRGEGKTEDLPDGGLQALRAREKVLAEGVQGSKRVLQNATLLHKRVTDTNKELDQLTKDAEALKSLASDVDAWMEDRLTAFRAAIETFREERAVMSDLYAPLAEAIAGISEETASFSLRVVPNVDAAAWIKEGEGLFDLRLTTEQVTKPGQIRAYAAQMKTQWKSLDTDGLVRGVRDIYAALNSGRPATELLAKDVTLEQVALWLFSIEHVSLGYDIYFDDTPLMSLSPGTRGIALLTLFLGIDEDDSRPLLIDQPDENLDNASIYRSLRPFFQAARLRRQVVIVTHNPNLVVGTDADQIIVASASPSGRALPTIDYHSGGLETGPQGDEASMTEQICAVLEGGREAFRARVRRYESSLVPPLPE